MIVYLLLGILIGVLWGFGSVMERVEEIDVAVYQQLKTQNRGFYNGVLEKLKIKSKEQKIEELQKEIEELEDE